MAVKHGYHPTNRQPLATEVDQARMQSILAKHCAPKPQVPIAEAAQTPKAERPALEWAPPDRPGARGYYSLCKRYSCASVTVCGKDFFEAWVLEPGGSWFRPLASNLKSFDEAEKACQAHSAARVA